MDSPIYQESKPIMQNRISAARFERVATTLSNRPHPVSEQSIEIARRILVDGEIMADILPEYPVTQQRMCGIRKQFLTAADPDTYISALEKSMSKVFADPLFPRSKKKEIIDALKPLGLFNSK